MGRRVYVYGKAKVSSTGAEAKASLKVATVVVGMRPEPRDLPVARLNDP